MDEDAKRQGDGGLNPEPAVEASSRENVRHIRPRHRPARRGLRRISLADLTRVAAFVASNDGE